MKMVLIGSGKRELPVKLPYDVSLEGKGNALLNNNE